jgi:UDP-N-acetylmuramoyl-L-alanyl-D-glutamate--2,6-diaminopimelate ligase
MRQKHTRLHWSLKDLLSEWSSVSDEDNVFVTGISEYSGDVVEGDLFIASSGSDYCDEAIMNGAVAIIFDSRLQIVFSDKNYKVPLVSVDSLNTITSEIILRFYHQGINQIKTIAITGTDGKTSVAHLTAQALENAGRACGLIGTLGYGRMSSLSASTHTTPPLSRLAREYYQLEESGCDVVAVEASSHGIVQNRLKNIAIHTAVLTNITRDHLDYHKTVEEYIEAKAKLFFEHQPKCVAINIDDPNGNNWCGKLKNKCRLITYSLQHSNADVYAKNVKYIEQGISLSLFINSTQYDLKVPLLGEFNVMNILAVVAVMLSLDMSDSEIIRAIQQVHPVPGRMQVARDSLNISVVVDFAHTPAALNAAIDAMRLHFSGNLICVFGCGGERDKGKRPEMGGIATSFADKVVITLDNPRNEDPEEIINEIVQGCGQASNYTVIMDRRDAIAYALKIADIKDAVLIAGKGHEKFQQIGNQTIAFDDVIVANEEMGRMAHG